MAQCLRRHLSTCAFSVSTSLVAYRSRLAKYPSLTRSFTACHGLMSSGAADANLGQNAYNYIYGVESLEKYRPGGYHPIMIGDLLHDRYRIVDKLGYGGYSTVWLVHNTRLKSYVAVKVGIADSLPYEIKNLKDLSRPSSHPGRSLIAFPLDEFKLQGPNGTHPCFTMTPARCNLREILFSRLFPLEVARAIAFGVTLAVAYTHSRGYVHGDIHLRNILVKLPSSFDQLSIEELYKEYGEPETAPITLKSGIILPPNVAKEAVFPLDLGIHPKEFSITDARVILADFGEAYAPAVRSRLGRDCHTPVSERPPEARFEPERALSYPADIWCLATTLWDIIGMKAIFSSEFTDAEDIVCQHIDVLGPMPSSWWNSWEGRHEFFDESGNPKQQRHVWHSINDAFEEGVQKYRKKDKMSDLDADEKTAFLDLIRAMLKFDPTDRPTAQNILNSEWMVKWAMPNYQQSLETT